MGEQPAYMDCGAVAADCELGLAVDTGVPLRMRVRICGACREQQRYRPVVATDGGQDHDELRRVSEWDAHGNPYWNGVACSGGKPPGVGKLHRARIENGRVAEIECGTRAESWVPFDADSVPTRDRQTCSKCTDLTRVPGVERGDHWNRVTLTETYAPAEWSPKPATDGGQPTDRFGTPYPPVVDGVDLLDEDVCPVCESTGEFLEQPAGYYTCQDCFSTWAGDPDDADIVEYNDPSLVTDGGHAERPDPADDPQACSHCGVHIGLRNGDYCDGCAREIGAKPPLRRCLNCGQRAPEPQMTAIDVSPEDDYYPEFEYLCPGCSDGGGDDAE